MPAMDWKSLNFKLREVIAALVFVFTVSGVWYRLTYETADQQKEFEKYKVEVGERITDMQSELRDVEQRLRTLEDDKTRRDAVEADRMSRYHSMTKIK